jgi:hypothetical protein
MLLEKRKGQKVVAGLMWLGIRTHGNGKEASESVRKERCFLAE